MSVDIRTVGAIRSCGGRTVRAMSPTEPAFYLQPPRRRRWLIPVVVAAVVVLGAAGWLSWRALAGGGLTVTGTVELRGDQLMFPGGTSCQPAAALADLPGAAVTVRDGAGEVVGLGRLASAARQESGVCRYAFTVDGVVAGRGFYEIAIGGRGGHRLTEAELAEPVRLTL